MPRCGTLHNLPCTGVLGSYGGGDANRVAKTLFLVSIDPSAVTSVWPSIREQIWAEVVKTFEEQQRIAEDQRVAILPCMLVQPTDVEWSCTLHIATTIKVSIRFAVTGVDWWQSDRTLGHTGHYNIQYDVPRVAIS